MADWAEMALLWWLFGKKKVAKCENCAWCEDRVFGRSRWCHYHNYRESPWSICKYFQVG